MSWREMWAAERAMKGGRVVRSDNDGSVSGRLVVESLSAVGKADASGSPLALSLLGNVF